MLKIKVGDKITGKDGVERTVGYVGVEEDDLGNKILDIRLLDGIVKFPNSRGRLKAVLSVSKQNVYPKILNGAVVKRYGIIIFGYKAFFANLFKKIKRKILHIF